jgi:hypothetical protein
MPKIMFLEPRLKENRSVAERDESHSSEGAQAQSAAYAHKPQASAPPPVWRRAPPYPTRSEGAEPAAAGVSTRWRGQKEVSTAW